MQVCWEASEDQKMKSIADLIMCPGVSLVPVFPSFFLYVEYNVADCQCQLLRDAPTGEQLSHTCARRTGAV